MLYINDCKEVSKKVKVIRPAAKPTSIKTGRLSKSVPGSLS
ncbi:protein of unknown function [Paenibacillus alvei]|uniref:Uncharacterized protein n=1 Tax=Paenibacillus alvei TaxID=44250 RepID=A0A383RI16_PAEAL|nr:protein of unknown function [Paenibacillus alvei]